MQMPAKNCEFEGLAVSIGMYHWHVPVGTVVLVGGQLPAHVLWGLHNLFWLMGNNAVAPLAT